MNVPNDITQMMISAIDIIKDEHTHNKNVCSACKAPYATNDNVHYDSKLWSISLIAVRCTCSCKNITKYGVWTKEVIKP
jgi:hypothetical protein